LHPLKFEWAEGPHGVDRLKIIGAEGIFTFAPNPASGFDTTENPFDRAAALEAVKSLADGVLKRLAEGHHTHGT
jgi:hypothetical protein